MDLRERLRLEHPVVQAGMGGGLAGAELAGAVSRAGGLGTVGMLPTPQALHDEILRARTIAPGHPIAANLLLPFARPEHAQACIDAGADSVALFCGFDRGLVERLRAAGILVLHQVGTPEQGRRALDEGADGLIAQGIEAGGHLLGVEPAERFLARALELADGRPVLMAGGIAQASDTRRALDAGAAAVVAGTRFLLTHESAAHPAYKQRALGAQRTVETLLFSMGWYDRHRVLPNAATERWGSPGPRAVLAFNRISAPLMARAPMRMTIAALRLQRLALPLYSPAAVLEGMSERLLEVTPLYAGETAARITGVMDAESALRSLVPA